MASSKVKIGLGIAGGLGLLAAVALATRKRGAGGGSPSLPGCLAQPPQDFLIRQNYLKAPGGLDRAITYRTKHYGYVQGFGDPSLNPTTPAENSTKTTFFGIPVTLNRAVVASLRCVEGEIKATCGTGYQPQSLSGLRTKNTYAGSEVSNHVYGIALDVDPLLNPCCGCRGHWADDPRCSKKVSSEFERMDMPECWVHVFEKFGWYWLGHDPNLRDTMHFEFLGEPPLRLPPRLVLAPPRDLHGRHAAARAPPAHDHGEAAGRALAHLRRAVPAAREAWHARRALVGPRGRCARRAVVVRGHGRRVARLAGNAVDCPPMAARGAEIDVAPLFLWSVVAIGAGTVALLVSKARAVSDTGSTPTPTPGGGGPVPGPPGGRPPAASPPGMAPPTISTTPPPLSGMSFHMGHPPLYLWFLQDGATEWLGMGWYYGHTVKVIDQYTTGGGRDVWYTPEGEIVALFDDLLSQGIAGYFDTIEPNGVEDQRFKGRIDQEYSGVFFYIAAKPDEPAHYATRHEVSPRIEEYVG